VKQRGRRAAYLISVIVPWVMATPAFADTEADCRNTETQQLKAVEDEALREWRACQGDRQCAVQMQNKRERIIATYTSCRNRALGQSPQPPVHWKPGDRSPVAPDGRRYIMSCSGKVLGLYKPGGALEMELKTHPGNCFPNDNPWPGPGVGGTVTTEHCYEKGTGAWKEYSGGRPSWCDPTR